MSPYLKNKLKDKKRTVGMAQVVEHLLQDSHTHTIKMMEAKELVPCSLATRTQGN
jgi:hypothetical protein